MTRALTVFALLYIFVGGIALAACGGALVQSPEACLAPRLVVIEGAFATEAIARCRYQGWNMCISRDEIEAKYDREREIARQECDR